MIKYAVILKFAEDVKLVQIIKWASDSDELQEDINSLTTWAVINIMPISCSKRCSPYYKSGHNKHK